MIDLAQAAALNERLLKLLRLMRQVFQPPLAPGHDCAFDKIFGGLFGCLGGHRHIYSVRAVQDHFAVLGGNFGRLVVSFLIAHGGRNAGSLPPFPMSAVAGKADLVRWRPMLGC